MFVYTIPVLVRFFEKRESISRPNKERFSYRPFHKGQERLLIGTYFYNLRFFFEKGRRGHIDTYFVKFFCRILIRDFTETDNILPFAAPIDFTGSFFLKSGLKVR